MSPQVLRPDDDVVVSTNQSTPVYHEVGCAHAGEGAQTMPRHAARSEARLRPAECCHGEADR